MRKVGASLAAYLIVTGLWGVTQFVSLGPAQFGANAELLRKTTLMHVLTVEPRNWMAAFGVLGVWFVLYEYGYSDARVINSLAELDTEAHVTPIRHYLRSVIL